jgi:hypothetical protein
MAEASERGNDQGRRGILSGAFRVVCDATGAACLQRRTLILDIHSWETLARGEELEDVFCAICASMPADKPWASPACKQQCRKL